MGRSRERLSKEPAIRRSGGFAHTLSESEYRATLKDPSIFFAHFEHHPRLHSWEGNLLHMHQLRQLLPSAALAPVCSLAASVQKHRKTVTRTEAATNSHDAQTKGLAKTVRAYHAEISARHTSLGGNLDIMMARRVWSGEDLLGE
jgi:hypothetical protein